MLSVAEAASIFRVSPQSIYRWVEDGTLPALKLGNVIRIHPEAIDALIEKARTGA